MKCLQSPRQVLQDYVDRTQTWPLVFDLTTRNEGRQRKYYEKLKTNGENVYIDSLKYEELQMIGKVGLERRYTNRMEADTQEQNADTKEFSIKEQFIAGKDAIDNDRSNMEADKNKINVSKRKPPIRGADTITNRLIHWSYSEGQKDELKLALHAGVPKHDILNYFYPDTTLKEMQRIRIEFMEQIAEN
jgi:type IV secretion system protein VirD4